MRESRGDSSGVRFPPPALYLLALVAGYCVQHRWPILLAPALPRAAVVVAGAALFLLGAALAASGVLTFRKAGVSPNPTRPTVALTVGGPYRFTRNPMYLGLAVASAGIAVAYDAFWPLPLIAVAAALMVPLVIAREERYLESKFGEEYRRYRSRVRRWI